MCVQALCFVPEVMAVAASASLFAEHMSNLEEQAAASRRRYALGNVKRDPDVPRTSNKAPAAAT